MNDHHHKIMTENYQQPQAPASSRLVKSPQADDTTSYFVTADWLKRQLDQERPQLVVLDVTRGAGNYKLDVTRGPDDYVKGHIPGAIHLNTDELGEFKDYFKSAEAMRDVFLAKGVTKDSLVVFYSVYARDIMYIASRMAFAAHYLGVNQVKILDGGLQAWERSGYPLETGEVQAQLATDFGIPVPKHGELLIKTPEDLRSIMDDSEEELLVSVRTWNEFTGRNEGHAWNKGAGEILGAVYAGDELLVNVNGEMADPSVYLDQFASWGIRPDQDIILYCGTSWRSSTLFFVLKELGWPHVRMFDGSWYKWYQAHLEDPAEYPIQQGDPRNEAEFRVLDRQEEAQ